MSQTYTSGQADGGATSESTTATAMFQAGGNGAAADGALRFNVRDVDVELDPLRGVQRWAGTPAVVMWIDSTVAGLMLGLQRMVGTERFNLALQGGGRDSVSGDWAVISAHPTFEEGFQAIANIASAAGWGGWEIVSIDREAREARFRSRSCWEGLYQKRLGVCWGSSLIAGKFAGMATRLFGVNCWSEQTAFIARGDEADEFLVRPSDRTIEGELDRLLESDAATRADLAVALRKLMREVEERRAAEEALRRSEQEKLDLIARQQQTIVTMATPIIQVWKGVLTLPIVGALDAARAADVMEQLLQRIVTTSAHAAIIDLTGVESVDESTADHLLRIVRAIKLLGAHAVITGIRPAVAQSIVALGVDLAALTPMANLEEGLKLCWRWMAPSPGARPAASAP